MSDYSVKIHGLKELRKNYMGSKKIINKHASDALDKGIDVLKREAESEAPVKSGRLKGSIRKMFRPRNQLSRAYHVGVIYGRAQEYGRTDSKPGSPLRPQWYIRNSIRDSIHRIERINKQMITKILNDLSKQ